MKRDLARSKHRRIPSPRERARTLAVALAGASTTVVLSTILVANIGGLLPARPVDNPTLSSTGAQDDTGTRSALVSLSGIDGTSRNVIQIAPMSRHSATPSAAVPETTVMTTVTQHGMVMNTRLPTQPAGGRQMPAAACTDPQVTGSDTTGAPSAPPTNPSSATTTDNVPTGCGESRSGTVINAVPAPMSSTAPATR